jgi:hypothetical protein
MLLDMPLLKIFDLRKMSSFLAFKSQKKSKANIISNRCEMERLERKDPGVAPLPDNHIYIYKVYTFLKLIGVQSNHNIE